MQPPADEPTTNSRNVPSQNRVVLIGGSIRAAAESARRAGLKVYGVDSFADTDAIAACHDYCRIDQIVDANDRCTSTWPAQVPIVLAGGLADAAQLEHVMAVLARPLLGPGDNIRRRLNSVKELRVLAHAAGLRFPASQASQPESGRRSNRVVPEGTSDPSARSNAGSWWLRKPVSGSGGIGIKRSGELEPVAGVDDEYRQQWIAGRSIGVVFLATEEDVFLLAACRSSFTRRCGRSLFAYAGSAGPLSLEPQQKAGLLHLGRHCAESFGVRGLFNADVILDRQSRVWLLEINPRWSSSCEIIERFLLDNGTIGPAERVARSLFELHWKALRGKAVPDWKEVTIEDCSFWYWKRVVYPTCRGRWMAHALPDFRVLAPQVDVRLADIPASGTAIDIGEPIATLLCRVPKRMPFPLRTKRRLIAGVRQAVCDC